MIRVDQSLRCLGFGFYGSFDLSEQRNGTLRVYCVPGINLSIMTASVDIQVGDDRESSKEDYTAISPAAELGVEYTQWLRTSHFTFRFSGGFSFPKKACSLTRKAKVNGGMLTGRAAN